MEEKTAEQRGYSMTQTEIDLREAWDRTCAERDDLKNQVKALSAIKRGLETSLSECQKLLASPPIGEREDGFLKGEVGSSVSTDPHTREVAEKAVDEALDVVFKDCTITDIATDCIEQSGKQFLKDKILARLNPEGK